MSFLIDTDMYAPAISADAETAAAEKPAKPEEEVSSSPTDLAAWVASMALKGIEKISLPKKTVTNDDLLKEERLRTINLAAAEVWEIYNKEGERIEYDNSTGLLGHAVGFVDFLFRSDGKTVHDDRAEKWVLERELVAEIKKKLSSREATTLKEALHLIRSDGPPPLRELAKRFLEEKGEFGHRKGYPLWELVDFASRPDKDPVAAHDLLERAFELEYDNDAVEAPFAVYSLVRAVSSDPKINEKAEEGMKALSGESGFGRAALKFVFSSSPEEAALDVGLMFASAGLGNLAKLKTLARLEKVGMTGYKAVALAKAAEMGAETTALWALNTGREVLTHDVGKALDPVRLAKSLAATGLMVGFLKVFGAAGEGIAERLGFASKAAEGAAKLPFWRKVAGFTIGHGSGLAGMIASTKAGEALELHAAPTGGANESLVRDLLAYVKFALAYKAADRLLGGSRPAADDRPSGKIAVEKTEGGKVLAPNVFETTMSDAVPEDLTPVARPVPKDTRIGALRAAARRKIVLADAARPVAKKLELKGEDGSVVHLTDLGPFYKMADLGKLRLSLYADAKRGYYTMTEVDTIATIRTAADARSKAGVKVRRAGGVVIDVPVAARGKYPLELRDGDRLEYWADGVRRENYTFRAGTSKYSHLKPGATAVIPLKDIVPTQDVVFGAQVEAYASGLPVDGLPEVRVIGGVPYVADGHHRLYAAYRRGAKDVCVRVYDPSGDPPDLVPTLPERATKWEKITVRPSARIFKAAAGWVKFHRPKADRF